MRIVLAVLLVLGFAYTAQAHLEDCTFCHVHATGGALAAGPSAVCLTCHPERSGPPEHPVDISPEGDTGNLPLYEGLIACPTCHEPHGRTEHFSFLRVAARELCVICHQK